jgi:hypothetical protein
MLRLGGKMMVPKFRAWDETQHKMLQMDKWNFQLWLALNGAQHINTLFCKPINQSKPRWRRVKRLLEAQHDTRTD